MKIDRTSFILMFLMIFLSSVVFAKDKKPANDKKLLEWEKTTERMSTDSAILFYRDKLTLATKSGFSMKEEFHIRINLGSLYRLQADFTKALEFDLAAMIIAEKSSSPSLLGIACNSLGIDYYRNEDFDNAEKYFKLSINYNQTSGDKILQANSYYKLAMVLDDTGRQNEAMEYFSQALNIFKLQNDCMGSADVYNGMAAVYYKKNLIDSTEYYALLAMKYYEECGSLETVSFMYMNLASLKNLQKQHRQALNYLYKGLQLADSLNLLSQLRQGYKNLGETYAYIGDFANAYKSQLKYITYKDSIFNNEKAETFLELNTKYETEKKEKEIVAKQSRIDLQNVEIAKSNQQRNLLIVIVLLAFAITLTLIFRFNEKKKHAILLDSKNQELENINAAKDKLFSIISHDLSSPVASYSRLTEALKNSVDKLSLEQLKEYLSELNSSSKNIQTLLKNLLQWSLQQSGHFTPAPQSLITNELIESVILSLKGGADEKKIRVRTVYSYTGNVFADRKMTETVIRNILSNSIKFSPENSEISILVKLVDNYATISIVDSGPGLSDIEMQNLFSPNEDLSLIGTKNKNKGTGLGLILAREFTQMNNGKIFAEKSPNGGLSITIKLKTL